MAAEQQDAQGLRAVLGGGDHLNVFRPGLLVTAPGGAPRPVVCQLCPAEQGLADRFLGGSVAGLAVRGAAAPRAHGESGDGHFGTGEVGVVAPAVPVLAEVEAADDRLADVVHTEGGLLVPPGLLDVGRVDVDGGNGRVRGPGAAVAVVDDPRIIPFVMGGDLAGHHHPVQGQAPADAGAAAPRAGGGVLLGALTGADVTAFVAHPPRLQPGRRAVGGVPPVGAEIEAVDDVPVATYVVGVARGEFGERGLGGPVVRPWVVAPAGAGGLALVLRTGLSRGLLVAEHRLQAYAVLDEAVVGQQPVFDEKALGVRLGHLREELGDTGRLADQVALFTCLVLHGFLE